MHAFRTENGERGMADMTTRPNYRPVTAYRLADAIAKL